MAATPFTDLSEIDPSHVLADRQAIYELLPHRFEFMQLDAILRIDREAGLAVGLRHIRSDEFWVRGHIPGQPIMPGVLMLETAAQMASYLSQIVQPSTRFVAFGGLEDVKFRTAVIPPATMYIIEKIIEVRPRRTVCDAQGFVDGKLVFEARIIGMPLAAQTPAANAP
jgi:3-hydroxyacyl-[acyl-carrier-protein] dehydratase